MKKALGHETQANAFRRELLMLTLLFSLYPIACHYAPFSAAVKKKLQKIFARPNRP